LVAQPSPPPLLAQLLLRGRRPAARGAAGEAPAAVRGAAAAASESAVAAPGGSGPLGVEGAPAVVWWVAGCRRVHDNPALALARWLAWRLGLPLVAVVCLHPATEAAAAAAAAAADAAADAAAAAVQRDSNADRAATASATAAALPPPPPGPEAAPSLFVGRGAALYASALVLQMTLPIHTFLFFFLLAFSVCSRLLNLQRQRRALTALRFSSV
jgi:hypothetical protein